MLFRSEDDEGVFEKVFKDLFTKFKSGCFGGIGLQAVVTCKLTCVFFVFFDKLL